MGSAWDRNKVSYAWSLDLLEKLDRYSTIFGRLVKTRAAGPRDDYPKPIMNIRSPAINENASRE